MSDTASNSPPLERITLLDVCPCCSRPFDFDNDNTSLSFDYLNGIVFCNDSKIQLCPTEADLLKILLDSWPVVLSNDAIKLRMYGGVVNAPKFGFRQAISRLRGKLRSIGLQVTNDRKRGYRLSLG